MSSLDPRPSSVRDFWARFCGYLVEPDVLRPRRSEMWLLFALAFFLGAIVRAQYWHTGFGWDDRYTHYYLGLVATGRMSVVEFIFHPWQVHLVPLLMAMYYLVSSLFGISALALHIVFDLCHAATAPALFGLALFFLQRRLPAFMAAWLWSALPTSHVDGPLIVVVMGGYAATVGFFMWTMYALTYLTSERARFWSILSRVFLCGAFAAWGASLTWTPVLLAQHFLSRRVAAYTIPAHRVLFLPWVTPSILFALFLIPYTLVMSPTWFPERLPMAEVLLRSGAQGVNALGHLVGPAQPEISSYALAWQSALAIVVLGLAMRQAKARPLVLLFLLWSGIYLSLSSYRRATEITWEESLLQGRMLYIPALFWCVTLGAAVDLGRWPFARRPAWACSFCLAVLVVFVVHQRSVAQVTLDEFTSYWAEADAKLEQSRALLSALADDDTLAADTVLPDWPIHIPPLYHSYYPVGAFRAMHGEAPTERLRFAPVSTFSDAQIADAQAMLLRQNSELAAEWERNLVQLYNDVRAIEWLDAFAEQRSLPAKIPDFERLYGGVQLRLSEIAEFGLATPPRRIEFVPMHVWAPGTGAQLVLALRASDEPQAARWLEALQNMQ